MAIKTTNISFKRLIISFKRYNKSFKRYKIEWKSKPSIAAMHDPHSLVDFGDQVRFGPIR